MKLNVLMEKEVQGWSCSKATSDLEDRASGCISPTDFLRSLCKCYSAVWKEGVAFAIQTW